MLALDLRGHGASDGTSNRFGWQGARDVGAAVKYLQARAEVKTIGGLELSLGGEVLLGAASLMARQPAASQSSLLLSLICAWALVNR